MTGFVGPGNNNPLSRITIAGLDDMGYAVNYNEAEPYGSGDLGTCNCNRRDRSLSSNRGTTKRRLNSDLYDQAVNVGRKVLSELSMDTTSRNNEQGLGSLSTVYVFWLDGDRIVDVAVTAEDI